MLSFLFRLMFPTWAVQAQPGYVGWRPAGTPLRWLIVAAVCLIAFLSLLGVLPGGDKWMWGCILALGLALIVP